MSKQKYFLYVAITCIFIYAITFYHYASYRSVLYGDPTVMAVAVESLYLDHDIDLKNQLIIKQTIAADQIALGSNGQWFPLHEPLLALVTVPFYGMLGNYSFILINWLIIVLLSYWLFLYLCSLFHPVVASGAILLTFLSLPFTEYSYSYSIDVLGTALVCGNFILMVQKKYVIAGVVGGMILFARLPFSICNIPSVLFLIFCVYGNMKRSLRWASLSPLANYFIGYLFFAILFCIQNKLMFGSFFTFSYLHWISILPISHEKMDILSHFTPLSYRGLVKCIFSPDTGFIVSSPLAIISILFATPALIRYRKDVAILFIMFVIIFLMFFSHFLTGVPAYPNRYLLPIYALASIPLAALINLVISESVRRAC
ncbi:MAG: hypothetical protein IT292_01480 [Deltaproteobacteria bacterium]|nr:hypothetical protein [Deltaproteobacteria bacterium]